MRINKEFDESRIGCFEWREAVCNLLIQDDIKGNWYLENETEKVDMIIEYCPFCGSEIDKKGCTGGSK